MSDLVVSGIELNTSKLAQGVRDSDRLIASLETRTDQSAAAAKRAEQSYESFAKKGLGSISVNAQQAMSAVDRLTQQYEADLARIKEGQLRGFIKPAEARKAGVEAANAYNQGVLTVLDTGSRSGAFRGADGSKAFTEIAGSIKNVEASTHGARSGLNQIRASMTAVAASALSSAPGVAQLSGAIGTMALGSAVMVGAMAGAAAIGFAWDAITSKAREAAKAQEDALAQLATMAEQERAGVVGNMPALKAAGGIRQDEIKREITSQENRIAKAREILAANPDANNQRAAIGAAEEKIRELRQEFAKIDRDIGAIETRTKRAIEGQREGQKPKKGREEVDEFKVLTQALEEQRITLTDGKYAALEYSLALKGIHGAAAETIISEQKRLDAIAASSKAMDAADQAERDRRKSIDETVTRLNEENISLTQGTEALLRYQLGVKDAGMWETTFAVALLRSSEAAKAAKKANDEAARDAESAAERAARRAEAEAKRIDDSLKSAFSDSFTDFITGAESAEKAFHSFTTGVLRDLTNLASQKLAEEIFGTVLSTALGGGGAGAKASVVPGTFDPLTISKPWIGPGQVRGGSAMSSQTVHVHVSANYNVNALDPRTTSELLQAQAPTIVKTVVDAIDGSTAIRRKVRGR